MYLAVIYNKKTDSRRGLFKLKIPTDNRSLCSA